MLIIFEPGGELKIPNGFTFVEKNNDGPVESRTSTRARARSSAALAPLASLARRRCYEKFRRNSCWPSSTNESWPTARSPLTLMNVPFELAEVGEEHAAVAQRDARVQARDVAVVGEVDLAALAAERDSSRRGAGTPRR